MSNLTFDEKLIREHKAEPLEGHTVVVLERVGESGEKFHSLLEPGDDRPRQGLIAFLRGKPSVYFAFAVDASKHRLLNFSSQVEMAEHAYDFELHFSLWHRVSDAQLLVSTRASDPLELVRKKVIEVITEEMAELPWASVRHSFRAESDSLVARTLAEIKNFARDYGIAINSLRLRATFPERSRVIGARETLHDRIAHETTEKYAEFIGGTSSVDELREVQAKMSGASPALVGIHVYNDSNGGHALGPGNTAPLALPPGGNGLPSVLADLVTLTQGLTDGQRRLVRGILLHVVAAVVEDDSTRFSAVLTDFARRARVAIDDAADLPASHADALQAMADPQRLHQRLYP